MPWGAIDIVGWGIDGKAPKRPVSSRVHHGVVVVDEPNQRWCWDGFEITCANGEVVTGVFMKDCCDSEIIA